MTSCERCSTAIEVDEAQCCDLCERDGLGNCCIAVLDHQCPGPEPGTPVRIDYDVPGGKVTSAVGEFVGAKGSTAEVKTGLGIVAGAIDTVKREGCIACGGTDAHEHGCGLAIP